MTVAPAPSSFFRRRWVRHLLIVFACLGLLTGGTGLWAYFNQDKIIQAFVQKANEYLNAKVSVGHMSVSVWKNFPYVSIVFDQVEIQETLPKSKAPLARIGQLYFTFNLKDILNGSYRIQGLHMSHANWHLKILKNGRTNFDLFKQTQQDTATASAETYFGLHDMQLEDVQLIYEDLPSGQTYRTHIQDVEADFAYTGKDMEISTQGDIRIGEIAIGRNSMMKDRQVALESVLHYGFEAAALDIRSAEMGVDGATFFLAGRIETAGDLRMDLQFEGQNTTFQHLLALAPGDIVERLASYRTQGEVYFKGQVAGKAGGIHTPRVIVEFGCRNASFVEPVQGRAIEEIFLTGSFTNGPQASAGSSRLVLRDLKGKLGNHAFAGELTLSDFDQLRLQTNIDAVLDLGDALAFYPVPALSDAQGVVTAQLRFDGHLSAAGQQIFSSSGTFTGRNLRLQFADYALPVELPEVDLSLDHQNIIIRKLTSRIGGSDFALNGSAIQYPALLSGQYQDCRIIANLRAERILWDELFPKKNTTSGEQPAAPEQGVRLQIPTFRLALETGEFVRERLVVQQLQGFLEHQQDNMQITQMRAGLCEGQISGDLFYHLASRQLTLAAKSENLNIRKLFYTFENFGQAFLLDQHLEGRLTADVQANVQWQPDGTVYMPGLLCLADCKVSEGALLGFPPMLEMSAFLKNRDFQQVRFAELSNLLEIRDQKVHIPKMEIRSTVGRLFVGGTQGFDGAMDYRLQIPFAILRNPGNPEEALAATRQDAGGTNLFVKVTGVAPAYKISFDREATAEKIKNDLKREKEEFLDLFRRKKTEPAKSVGLSQEEL